MNVEGKTFSIYRKALGHNVVYASVEFFEGLSIEVANAIDGYTPIAIDDYRRALSSRLTTGSSDGEAIPPSFRELSYYFVRIGKDAYIDPQSAYRNQNNQSKRSNVSYLLGLNWRVQGELEDQLKARKSVQAALAALSDAAHATGDSSIGVLEAERVVLEKALKERRSEIEKFNLRGDYHDLELRLTDVDRTLHELINNNHLDRRLLQYYESSAIEVPLFDADRPIAILQDAGAIFKAETLRSLENVAAFHKQIYLNRSEFLSVEIRRLKSIIAERDFLIAEETREKSSVLRILASSGALDTLIELQQRTTNLSTDLEALKARIDERKRFDRRKDELTVEIAARRSLLKRDLEDRRDGVDEAIALFAEYTAFLYGVSGKLSVDVKDSGYRFTFTIDRQGSDGVDQMVVFCFDLMVATLRARRGAKFLMLIHDSTLFADVDPRQYGLALQLAARTSKEEGFQYICCLNGGALPKGHLGELDINNFIRLKLTDDSDAGRLLGRRLPPRE